MKTTSKHWLQERGTREGNRLIFSRVYTPSFATDIRETFQRAALDNKIDEFEVYRQYTLEGIENPVT
jgi:hypothetical protein